MLLAATAARTAFIRAGYVQSVRGIELRATHQWRNWIYRINPAELLAVSAFTRDQLLKLGARANRIHITYNGVDLERFDPGVVDGAGIRAEFGLGDGPVIGHVGNFSGWKGQDLLVRVAASLRQSVPGLRVVLVGKGPALDDVRFACRVPAG